MGIDAVARLLSVSAQKLMKGAYGIDRRILGGGLKRGRSSIVKGEIFPFHSWNLDKQRATVHIQYSSF